MAGQQQTEAATPGAQGQRGLPAQFNLGQQAAPQIGKWVLWRQRQRHPHRPGLAVAVGSPRSPQRCLPAQVRARAGIQPQPDQPSIPTASIRCLHQASAQQRTGPQQRPCQAAHRAGESKGFHSGEVGGDHQDAPGEGAATHARHGGGQKLSARCVPACRTAPTVRTDPRQNQPEQHRP